MASVHNVLAYLIKRLGPMTTMKAQKLLYYSQAWSMVWDGQPLFAARVEAWANGPVIPEIFREHRAAFMISAWEGDPDALTSKEKSTVDGVIRHYGHRTPAWLSDLSHREPPWKDARRGLKDGERGTKEITKEAMYAYYSQLG